MKSFNTYTPACFRTLHCVHVRPSWAVEPALFLPLGSTDCTARHPDHTEVAWGVQVLLSPLKEAHTQSPVVVFVVFFFFLVWDYFFVVVVLLLNNYNQCCEASNCHLCSCNGSKVIGKSVFEFTMASVRNCLRYCPISYDIDNL